jgi:hypothetical protein
MPFPSVDNPHYCPGSNSRPTTYDNTLHWQRCDVCRRPIVARADGRLFAHLDHPTRRNDDIQESLIRYGHNRAAAYMRAQEMHWAEDYDKDDDESGGEGA